MKHLLWAGGCCIIVGALAVFAVSALRQEADSEPQADRKERELSTTADHHAFTNRLSREKSPYLLQHAHNPVDWYPWGEEAFDKAREGNKPIFLSVGYSTCHWCHVMERESFENEEVAAILNKYFVAVKVDREERPDLDNVYMTFVQATTGGGGWPMSVWLTPELKPFVGGTYYPPEDKWGTPGFKSVLLQIAAAWEKDRDRIIASSETVLEELRRFSARSASGSSVLDSNLLDQAYRQIKGSYEPEYGGFGGAPKFPRPSAPDFMLRYYARTLRQSAGQAGAQDALDMTLFTLRKMAEGGMYDHIGGGFHRYSVDERWHVPHFEKMLYDQGQLACTYLDAYQITRDPFYAGIARGILKYVQRDLTGPKGNFYSAEDADSLVPGKPEEHAEGAFYVWEDGEIADLLDGESASIFNYYYGVEEDGNVRSDPHGEFPRKNVLIVSHTTDETARHFNKNPGEIRNILSEVRQRLLEVRVKRPRPHLDDKTITAWNGLMISGFARASQVLGDSEYLASAMAAAEFIRARMYDEQSGVLMRRYRAGETGIEGYVDDYAFLIRGLLDLYEASFEVRFLTWAIALQERQDELFRGAATGGYFNTTGKDSTVLLRTKNDYDGAEPSPNSISVLNLLRLAQMTDNEQYRELADKTLAVFSGILSRTPHAMPAMMATLSFHLDKPMQIIIAGNPDSPDTKAMLEAVHGRFIPNKILMLADGGEGQRVLAQHFEFISSIQMIDGKATAYICENNVCRLPVTDAEAMIKQLDKGL